MAYLEEVGEEKPTKALEDPVLLRRCLSQESPPALVAIVARNAETERIDTGIIDTLSDFEQGRIHSVLGDKKGALTLYRTALATCSNPATRGLILINLAQDTPDPAEQEELLEQAIDGGCDEAFVHLGMLLDKQGRTGEAIECLETSVKKGIGFGVTMLAAIHCVTKKGDDLAAALAGLVELARAAGIEDALTANAPTEQLFVHLVDRRRGPDGKPLTPNTLTRCRKLRAENLAQLQNAQNAVGEK